MEGTSKGKERKFKGRKRGMGVRVGNWERGGWSKSRGKAEFVLRR